VQHLGDEVQRVGRLFEHVGTTVRPDVIRSRGCLELPHGIRKAEVRGTTSVGVGKQGLVNERTYHSADKEHEEEDEYGIRCERAARDAGGANV
jgi:hypothetical protein